MSIVTRQQVIEQLQAAEQGKLEPQSLAGWAFDQFYAEEMGKVEFEPGYRRPIRLVLDDLMFSDQPGFLLSETELRQIIVHLEEVEELEDEDDDDEVDEDDQ